MEASISRKLPENSFRMTCNWHRLLLCVTWTSTLKEANQGELRKAKHKWQTGHAKSVEAQYNGVSRCSSCAVSYTHLTLPTTPYV